MRRMVFVGLFLLAFSTALTAQQKSPATAQRSDRSAPSAQRKFLAAGPFLFKPSAIQPTYMDAFDSRPVVKSPDGNAQITVTGPSESLKAWVTLQFLGGYVRGLEYQVWPIESDVDVLWRPDGQAFALTDNRYANRSYVLVCGTNFRMGENERGLGIPITDLTPIVERAFEKHAQGYYAGQSFDTPLFYAKTLRWTENDQLLVGVSARTMLANRHGSGSRTLRIRDWDLAYLVDVPSKKVVGVLSEAQLFSQYGIRVAE